MNYMINTSQGTEIYQNNKKVLIKPQHNLTLIKQLCINHLFTYQGYISAVKKVFKMSYKIPVYISDQHQWLATSNVRGYDNVWINFAQVKSYERQPGGTKVTFINADILTIKNKYEDIIRMVEKLKRIQEYKVKHFH